MADCPTKLVVNYPIANYPITKLSNYPIRASLLRESFAAAGELIRHNHFRGQQQDPDEQEIPPDALPTLGLFGGEFGGFLGRRHRRRRRTTGDSRVGAPVLSLVWLARPVTAATSSAGSSGVRSDSAGSRLTAMRSGCADPFDADRIS